MEDVAQRPVQIELDGLRPVFYALRIRDKLARVMFQLLQPDAVFVDFGFDVSVGGAGKRHCDRAGAAVPRQANHANVVGEVFAAKLCADAELAAGFEQRRFQRRIAKRLAQFVSAGGQIVVIFCRSQLRHLQRLVRRQAPYDKGDVVRRAGGGAQRLHFFNQEGGEFFRLQNRFCFLK